MNRKCSQREKKQNKHMVRSNSLSWQRMLIRRSLICGSRRRRFRDRRLSRTGSLCARNGNGQDAGWILPIIVG